MRKIKILWLDPADFIGGAELFSLDVLPFLAQDFDITVFTGKNPDFKTSLPPDILHQEFLFPRLKPITPLHLLRFLQSSWKLKQYIEHNTFDVVHTNSIRSHILASQALSFLSKSYRPKLSFFIHDFTFPSWAVKLFTHRAEGISVCSQAVQNDICTKGVKHQKTLVVYNGVDLKKFMEIAPKKYSSSNPVVGMLGRIDIWKGQDIFLQSLLLVQKEFPNVQYNIFGESSEHDQKTQEFEASLRHFVRKHRLEEYVKFCGFTPAAEAFSQIDILVHASTKPEPFGRVVIEALAAGVPCIASPLGGTKEIFTHKQEGLFVESHNPQELARNIILILKNQNLREKLIIEGKKLIEQKFTLEQTVCKLEQQWRKMVCS